MTYVGQSGGQVLHVFVDVTVDLEESFLPGGDRLLVALDALRLALELDAEVPVNDGPGTRQKGKISPGRISLSFN